MDGIWVFSVGRGALLAETHRKDLGLSPDFWIPQIDTIGADVRKIARADLLWDEPR